MPRIWNRRLICAARIGHHTDPGHLSPAPPYTAPMTDYDNSKKLSGIPPWPVHSHTREVIRPKAFPAALAGAPDEQRPRLIVRSPLAGHAAIGRSLGPGTESDGTAFEPVEAGTLRRHASIASPPRCCRLGRARLLPRHSLPPIVRTVGDLRKLATWPRGYRLLIERQPTPEVRIELP